MIISSTTFMYVVFSTDSWILHLDGLNDVSVWAAALIAAATYIIVSFAKVHLGQNYPSDCLLSLPPIMLIIALFYLLIWFDTVLNLCPACTDHLGNVDGFCYFDSPQMIQNDPLLLTRQTFSAGESNWFSTMVIAFGSFAIFSLTSIHPVEFWHKTPYFVPTIVAIYLFKNIILCPSAANDYRSVTSPMLLKSAPTFPAQKVITFSLVFFSYGTTWIVNNLLGNRTGGLLSYIIRTIFFGAILFQTLMTLITVRLILVDQQPLNSGTANFSSEPSDL